MNWAKTRGFLAGSDIQEAEYIRDKRDDHGHAYALRLYGKTQAPAPPLGVDPDTPQTLRGTLELVAKLDHYASNANRI